MGILLVILLLITIIILMLTDNKSKKEFKFEKSLIDQGIKIHCPFCSEHIFPTAKFCIHCSREIPLKKNEEDKVWQYQTLDKYSYLSDVGNFPFTNQYLIDEYYKNSKSIEKLTSFLKKQFPKFNAINEENITFLLKIQYIEI